MPPRRRGRNGNRSSAQAAGGDRLGTLPDEILHHVLSFLPAHDAVRRCVLARRWRDLWKFATRLHIQRKDLKRRESREAAKDSVRAARDFVDHLLLLRGGSPLDTCELHFTYFDDEDISRLNLWIRHILMCKVRVLSLDLKNVGYNNVAFDRLTLKSDHLKKLQFSNIYLTEWFDMDFSCCPTLEVLEFDHCDFTDSDVISSRSLKCLSIRDCCFSEDSRNRIDVPNLLSLRLQVSKDKPPEDRTPVLERMPSLVEAFVKLYRGCLDFCDFSADSGSGDCEHDNCAGCNEIKGDADNCVLLQGLSEARNLALMSYIPIYIFKRDLKFRPIFVNLKSLLLDEYWCVPSDFSALAYMLEHSPVLEKLTIQLCSKGPKSKIKVNGVPDPADRSAALSEHLKIVEVQCRVIDDKVLNVLKFLSKLGIRFRF